MNLLDKYELVANCWKTFTIFLTVDTYLLIVSLQVVSLHI